MVKVDTKCGEQCKQIIKNIEGIASKHKESLDVDDFVEGKNSDGTKQILNGINQKENLAATGRVIKNINKLAVRKGKK